MFKVPGTSNEKKLVINSTSTKSSHLNSKFKRHRFTPLKLLCWGFLLLFLMFISSLVLSDISYLIAKKVSCSQVFAILRQERIIFAIRMSAATSLTTLMLIFMTAIPVGYALSRFRFPGVSFANTLIDIPIIMPPVVAGISLLAFFSFGIGDPIKKAIESAHLSLVSGLGIVLCQYLVAVSYCIRSAKSAFQSIDPKLEQVAQVLGCSEWQTFWRISIPLAKKGLVAGGVMAWARSLGVFGPLMVFVGTGPQVLVMPTTLWLELSIGNIETAVLIALIMLAMAAGALTIVYWIEPKGDTV